MAICVGCGSNVAERATFCLNCGRAQADGTVTPTPTEKTLMWGGVDVAAMSPAEAVPAADSNPAKPHAPDAVAGQPFAPPQQTAPSTPYVAPLAPAEQLSERTGRLPKIEPIVVPRPDRAPSRVMRPVEPASIPSLVVDLKTMVERPEPRWESPTFFQLVVGRRRRAAPIARIAWIGFLLGLVILGAAILPVDGRFLWERLSPLTEGVFFVDVLPGIAALFHVATPALSLSIRARAFAQLLTAALILVPRAFVAPPLFAPDLTGLQVLVSLYVPPLLAACLWWRSRAYHDILPRVVCSAACVVVLALIVLPFGNGHPSLVSAAVETLRRAQLPDLRAFALPTLVYGLSAALGVTATLMRGKGIAGIWALVVMASFTVWLVLVAHAVAIDSPSGAHFGVVTAFALHGAASWLGLIGIVFVLAPTADDA
ncbi:MAG: hypothetical protein HYY84_17055 [Deltaproteobacteria bacterium]|nr:hypothetical protein [Deltaproteobacteria bacterium]